MRRAQKRKKKLTYTWDEVLEMDFPEPKERKEHMKKVKEGAKKLHEEYLRETAQRLRKKRELQGVSQKELAKVLGTKAPAISRIENGKQNISLKTLSKMCKALGLECQITIRPIDSAQTQTSNSTTDQTKS